MKIFIAYTLVVVGIPYFAGLLFGQILTLLVAMIVGLLRHVGLLGGSDAATAAQEILVEVSHGHIVGAYSGCAEGAVVANYRQARRHR